MGLQGLLQPRQGGALRFEGVGEDPGRPPQVWIIRGAQGAQLRDPGRHPVVAVGRRPQSGPGGLREVGLDVAEVDVAAALRASIRKAAWPPTASTSTVPSRKAWSHISQAARPWAGARTPGRSPREASRACSTALRPAAAPSKGSVSGRKTMTQNQFTGSEWPKASQPMVKLPAAPWWTL